MWNRTENQIDFYLIRHGMTAANTEHRYLGRTDEPLCAEGISQLQGGKWDWSVQPEVVLVSPMLRCKQSVEILFPNVPILEIPQWCEMDFGEFERKNYAELNGNAAYQAWIDSGGSIAFPGGESRKEFSLRVVEGMENVAEYLREQLLQRACPECDTNGEMCVAAVVHGGTIMALLDHYCEGDYYDYQVANGSGYHCRLTLNSDDIRFQIVRSVSSDNRYNPV